MKKFSATQRSYPVSVRPIFGKHIFNEKHELTRLGIEAILDRFLHRSELFQLTGRSYRLGSSENNSKGAKAPTGSEADKEVEAKAPKGAKSK